MPMCSNVRRTRAPIKGARECTEQRDKHTNTKRPSSSVTNFECLNISGGRWVGAGILRRTSVAVARAPPATAGVTHPPHLVDIDVYS